jgi:hypothetical protein
MFNYKVTGTDYYDDEIAFEWLKTY